MLGIGVGGEYPVEFQAAGISVRQRGGRTDECLDALKRLWTQQTCMGCLLYSSRWALLRYKLDDVTIRFAAARQGGRC